MGIETNYNMLRSLDWQTKLEARHVNYGEPIRVYIYVNWLDSHFWKLVSFKKYVGPK